MWLFFFSCSVSRGLSLSWAALDEDAAAAADCLDAVGVDEERSCSSRSSGFVVGAAAGEYEGSEELDAWEAGGWADGMVVTGGKFSWWD